MCLNAQKVQTVSKVCVEIDEPLPLWFSSPPNHYLVNRLLQVGRYWPSTRLGLQRGLLECLQHAAMGTVAMHDAWLPVEDNDEEDDGLGIAAMAGVWGVEAGCASQGYTDEDVQVGFTVIRYPGIVDQSLVAQTERNREINTLLVYFYSQHCFFYIYPGSWLGPYPAAGHAR